MGTQVEDMHFGGTFMVYILELRSTISDATKPIPYSLPILKFLLPSMFLEESTALQIAPKINNPSKKLWLHDDSLQAKGWNRDRIHLENLRPGQHSFTPPATQDATGGRTGNTWCLMSHNLALWVFFFMCVLELISGEGCQPWEGGGGGGGSLEGCSPCVLGWRLYYISSGDCFKVFRFIYIYYLRYFLW